MQLSRRTLIGALSAGGAAMAAERRAPMPSSANIGFRADNGKSRSECGIGALMPWADALWAVTYNSNTRRTGTGLGLYRIDEDLRAECVHLHDGTHANRFVHHASNQTFIGPYAIDSNGRWRFIEAFADQRLTATMAHLKDPANRVYQLTMEGLLYEMDVSSLKPVLLEDLTKTFGIDRPHFKGGCTAQNRVVVSSNGFYKYGDEQSGLFEWNGASWRALSRKPHMDCAARTDFGQVIFCTGWDESSALLWACVEGKWQRYRLPKASHAFTHAWQTEWMRIREVETEHYLMDIQGMFYELQPIAFEGKIWGVKPICQHLRTIPDYCSFRGLLAVAGNETTPNQDSNPVVGQPQSGIWFGKTDDLWSWGKPAGWGGPWRKAEVKRDTTSDPMLLTGFQNKSLHIATDRAATIEIQVDFLGEGAWKTYDEIKVDARGYRHHEFPGGFSAHWVRLIAKTDCTISAEFFFV
jgi:hypothetical protein